METPHSIIDEARKQMGLAPNNNLDYGNGLANEPDEDDTDDTEDTEDDTDGTESPAASEYTPHLS